MPYLLCPFRSINGCKHTIWYDPTAPPPWTEQTDHARVCAEATPNFSAKVNVSLAMNKPVPAIQPTQKPGTADQATPAQPLKTDEPWLPAPATITSAASAHD